MLWIQDIQVSALAPYVIPQVASGVTYEQHQMLPKNKTKTNTKQKMTFMHSNEMVRMSQLLV